MRNCKRIIAGIEEIGKQKWKIIFPMAYLIVICLIWITGAEHIRGLGNHILLQVCRWIFHICVFTVLTIGITVILMYWGGGNKKCKKIERDFVKNKFVDKKGKPPMVLSKKKKGHGFICEFYSCGLSLNEYEKQKGLIEVILGMKIVSIEMGRGVRYAIIKGVPNESRLDKKLVWKDELLDKEDFVLKLGERYFDDEWVDLDSTPHILVGGGTGSGKSSLLKLILYQCIQKGAEVIIGDFKGGVDYTGKWREKSTIIVEEQEFSQKLSEVVEIMKERQVLLTKAGATNIKEYNQTYNKKLRRIVVVCDEFAQVLTKKERDKTKKDLNSKIELQMEEISSLGRAFGVHMILSTQRPDADVLAGKIKTNLVYRICGRADSVLSKIIIDSTDASELISQKDIGFFVTNFHTFFKAYYFDDSCWKEE